VRDRLLQLRTDFTNGSLLLKFQDDNETYAIILYNVRTYRSAGVIEVVRGKAKAETTRKAFEDSQSSTEQHEGWRYVFEKSDLTPGTGAEEATNQRQAALDQREAKETREEESREAESQASKPGIRPSSNPRK
jgi:hypothetical protein